MRAIIAVPELGASTSNYNDRTPVSGVGRELGIWRCHIEMMQPMEFESFRGVDEWILEVKFINTSVRDPGL